VLDRDGYRWIWMDIDGCGWVLIDIDNIDGYRLDRRIRG